MFDPAQTMALLETATDGVVRLDAQGRVHELSPGARRLWGYDAELPCDLRVEDLFAEAWQEPARIHVALLAQEGPLYERHRIGQGLARHHKGHEFPVELNGCRVPGPDQPPILLMARDIAGRIQTQAQLSRNAAGQEVLNHILGLSLQSVPLDQLLPQALEAILSFPWLRASAKGALFLADGDDLLTLSAHLNLEPGQPEAWSSLDPGPGGLAGFPPLDQAQGKEGFYGQVLAGESGLLGLLLLHLPADQRLGKEESGFLRAVIHTLTGMLEKRRAQEALARSEASLRAEQERLAQDLRAAATVQGLFLPQETPGLRQVVTAWRFWPCEYIGGDTFNLSQVGPDLLAFYIIDVSGHGVASALVTVSVHEVLASHNGFTSLKAQPNSWNPLAPAKVMEHLAQAYPVERFDKTFTIFYGVLDASSGVLTYASAGHSPAFLMRGSGELLTLYATGPLIGLGDMSVYEQKSLVMQPEDRLVLYTDGVVEYEDPQGEFFGVGRLNLVMAEARQESLDNLLENICQALRLFGQGRRQRDDVSLLGLELRSV